MSLDWKSDRKTCAPNHATAITDVAREAQSNRAGRAGRDCVTFGHCASNHDSQKRLQPHKTFECRVFIVGDRAATYAYCRLSLTRPSALHCKSFDNRCQSGLSSCCCMHRRVCKRPQFTCEFDVGRNQRPSAQRVSRISRTSRARYCNMRLLCIADEAATR